MASTSIVFDILARDRASAKFAGLGDAAKRAESRMSQLGKAAKVAAIAGFAVAGAAAVKFAVDSARSLARIERINIQTAAAIESTGGAANVSARQVEGLAGRLESLTATEAESIQQGANFLLTFTNIRNGVGESNKIFDQAVMAMTDMSRAMDQTGSATLDTRSQALQLGKALNDPIKGIAALQRVGVAFTEGQKDQIETLVESGRTMDAQRIILRELTKEFGGSGEAFARTTTGKIELAKHALGTFGETIMAEVLPAVAELADRGTEGLTWLTAHADDFKAAFAEVADAVEPAVSEIAEALSHLAGEGDSAGDAWDGFIAALSTAADGIASVVDFIDDLPGPIKDIGVQAAVAALILPKLTGAVQGVTGSVGGFVTTMRDAETRTRLLGQTARTAAGVGGMLALVSAAQETDETMGALKTTLGSAGIGGALAGPWGAAIGGAIGLGKKFADHMFHARERVEDTIPPIESMADSLDRLTGSLTAATRVSALENLRSQAEAAGFSVADFAALSGTSVRTLVDAALGGADAMDKVYNGLRRNGEMTTLATRDLNGNVLGYYESMSDGAGHLTNALGGTARQLRADRREVRETSRAAQELAGKLKGIPPNVRSTVKAEGVPVTLRGLAQLTKNAKLVPKQIRTLIKAADLPFTVKQVRDFQEDIEETDKKHAAPKFSVDDRRFKDAIAGGKKALKDFDGLTASPSATINMNAFYSQRAALLNSLNTIPDEDVNVWVHRRVGGGGDGTGGGADLGQRTVPRTVPRGVAAERSMLRSAYSVQSSSAMASTMYAAPPRRVVVEVRVVGGELDLTKAKVQLDGIAREVARDEIRDERAWLRTQE